MLEKNCVICGKKFFKKSCESKKYWSTKKCCSRECGLKISGYKKGSKPWCAGKKGVMPTPWNKGTVGIMKVNSGSFKKGEHLGKEHHLWKGDNATIKCKHSWVKRRKGLAKKCSFCGKTKNIDWANVDHQYKRNLDDYIELCRSCHRLYDIKSNSYKLKVK